MTEDRHTGASVEEAACTNCSSANACAICRSGTRQERIAVKEMMQGKQLEFYYTICGNCGTLQLENMPADVAAWYTHGYYSNEVDVERMYLPAWKGMAKKYRDRFCLTGKGILGWLVNQMMPDQRLELYHYRQLHLKSSHKILDVGCGKGKLTYCLYNAGFSGTMGLEPFMENDIRYPNGLLVAGKWLAELEAFEFDTILFNHSFEHIPDPAHTLNEVYRRLKPGGLLYIRIPTVSSYAWQHYGVHWVQLDAPRHCYLYSINGLTALVCRHGFQKEWMAWEGTTLQFIGSEQYKMGIPMYGDKRSWFEGNKELFSKRELQKFKQQAIQLNREERGDAIAVCFKKIACQE